VKILSVVGARPNFVKIAAVLTETRKLPWIQTTLVHTGQHYDPEMSGWFFRDLGIPRPDVNLQEFVNAGPVPAGATLSGMRITEMARRLEPVLKRERPDVVLVVGDVDSTVAGALAAVRLGIRVAHLEAGLRSFDLNMPEEINRIATDAISDLLFASEPSGVRNLLNEGKGEGQTFLAGNVMIDTLKRFISLAGRSAILEELGLRKSHGDVRVERYAVVTLHRAATVDSPEALPALWETLSDVAAEIPMIFPIHPRTAQRLKEARLKAVSVRHPDGKNNSIRLIPPLSYVDFLWLENNAEMVITDSGGIQEETTALGVPCLTVRNNTERPITVTEGTNTIVGLDPHRIRQEARRVLSGHGKQGRIPELWDGHAAKRIIKILVEHFQPCKRAPAPAARFTPNQDILSA